MGGLRIAGGLLVALALAVAVGAVVTGEVARLIPAALPCLAAGALLVYLGQGWDMPLQSPAEIHRWGRPAPAVVLAVSEAQLDPRGTRTAKLELEVRPVNERRFRTTRVLELPGGHLPAPGAAVHVKFDPHARKHLVLL